MLHGLRFDGDALDEGDAAQILGEVEFLDQLPSFHPPAWQGEEGLVVLGFGEEGGRHGGSFLQPAVGASIAIAFHPAKR